MTNRIYLALMSTMSLGFTIYFDVDFINAFYLLLYFGIDALICAIEKNATSKIYIEQIYKRLGHTNGFLSKSVYGKETTLVETDKGCEIKEKPIYKKR